MARTRWLFGLLAIGCALLMPLAAEAAFNNGFVNSSDGSSSLQTFSAPTNSGTQFWDHLSSDGTNCNVGFFLTRATALSECANGPSGNGQNISPGNLRFLGNGLGTAAHFAFNSAIPGTTFVFTDTGNRSGDALYWYDTSVGPVINGSHLIFTASTATGTSTTISGLPASWGLFLVGVGSSQYLSNGSGFDQFALFFDTSTSQYYAGMEDLNVSGPDRDFNDMVVKFAPVPEPATMFLGGLGLIAFGYAARRRLFGR